jgi:hypothetical protein
MGHYHVDERFLCVMATMMGWFVAPKCDSELVELCSEMVVGDVSFLPDRNSMLDEVRRRSAGEAAVRGLRDEMQVQPA